MSENTKKPEKSKIVFDKNASTELRTRTDKEGAIVRTFTFTMMVKGQPTEITLFGETAQKGADLRQVATTHSNIGRYLAGALSAFTLTEAEKNGVNLNAMLKAIAPHLDSNTIAKYRKAGLIFSKMVENEKGERSYHWKEPIEDRVSVTNLTACLGLLGLPKDTDKLTRKECNDAFDRFVKEYGIGTENPLLDLCASLSTLRKQISDLNNTIEGTASELSSEPASEPASEPTSEPASEPETSTPKTEIVNAIAILSEAVAGNSEASDLLARLVVLLEIPDAPTPETETE